MRDLDLCMLRLLRHSKLQAIPFVKATLDDTCKGFDTTKFHLLDNVEGLKRFRSSTCLEQGLQEVKHAYEGHLQSYATRAKFRKSGISWCFGLLEIRMEENNGTLQARILLCCSRDMNPD